MLQQFRARIGNVAFVAIQAALGLLGFIVLCVIMKASFIPGLILALRSLLYMLPLAGAGVVVIWLLRTGHLGEKVGTPILGLLFALCVGVVLILWAERNPFKAYAALIDGSLTSWQSISEMLVYATPLIFTGLSVALAFRCGLFNIGAEGQFIVGQMGAAWAGYAFRGLPAIIHLPLTLCVGIMAGMLWGSVPGFLKARRGVHEVIITIMMNYIALYLTHYLVVGPLMAPPRYLPVTCAIAETAKLPRLLTWISPNLRVNAGLILALLTAVFIFWLLWKTTTGFEIRAVGYNQNASKYGGISVSKNIVLAMVLAGGLSGMAGAVHVMGIQYKFVDIFSFTGYGFDGIAVALMGNNHPAGVLLGSVLFGALSTGASRIQLTADVPKQIIVILQSIIIFFVAAAQLVKLIAQAKKKPETVRAGKEAVKA
ncbi:MAG: ABC transporter permease [Planctomycetaceae bacterium]|nr:MAG: ABC transporter permease [Planctomycetaceae bacterium]